MVVQKNYSAAVLQPAGRNFVAILHPQPGLDDTFQLIGTGEPFADPDISCEGLVDRNASIGDCALGPYFTIDSDWASLELGRFRANIAFNLWVLQSIITIDFGPDTKVTIGHDLYGARITEGGDGTSSSAVVSLLPLKHCLGMYKDQSCNNAIGFSAVVTPAMIELPRISCVLTRGLPEPPPPSPPNPPPSPPPGFLVDPNLCYLGGNAHFVIAPHKVAAQAALQTWVVAVHLDSWLPGLRVVLDFPGVMHAEHGLHVHSVSPPEVARLVSVTRHSAVVELLQTAARDFRFEALGDVDEESHNWGLIISVCLMLYVGYHAKEAQKDPEPYMIKTAENVRWLRTTLAGHPAGRKLLLKVMASFVGQQLMQLEARYLGLPGSGATAAATMPPASTGAPKPKTKKTRANDEEVQEPLVGQPTIDGFDDDDDDDGDGDGSDSDEGDSLVDFGEKGSPPDASPMKTEFVVKSGGATRRRKVDLRGVRDMASLQAFVAKTCNSLGVDPATGGLRMQFVDAGGVTRTVSRSTQIEDVCNARELLMVPKSEAAKASGGGASSSRSSRGPMAAGLGGGME